MDIPGGGKSPNTSFSFRYNANNEELEELSNEDDPPTPQRDASPSVQSGNASPKWSDKSSSLIDKYFKSMRADKSDKSDEFKSESPKTSEEVKTVTPSKEVTASPVKEYLNRLSKRNTSADSTPDLKEGPNETWKLFSDFKYKIAQAVEDMKSRSNEETKDKVVPRENSTSDSEENSATKDLDHSVGDTDNQVSSLDSSIQNLSELTQPVTAKANDFKEPRERTNSESTDDTHKCDPNESADITKDLVEDNILEIESGVEALEDIDMSVLDGNQTKELQAKDVKTDEPAPAHRAPNIQYEDKSDLEKTDSVTLKPQSYFMNLPMYFITILLVSSYFIFPQSNMWNGFLLGVWFFCVLSSLKQWVLDKYFSDWESDKRSFYRLRKSRPPLTTFTIPTIKEHSPMKKYEGWINHYRYADYDPYTYHINKTTTAFMKLEGCNLRISYTKTKVGKRALWDEKIEGVTFYQHRLYNLTGAKVVLLPKGLVSRRQWSKKYPICVILNENENIQVLERETIDKKPSEPTPSEKKKEQETEKSEVNSSPEKRRKFVWRKKEKSITHTDPEPGKEGLRHRIVRKMHRDKKSDSASTVADTISEASPDKNEDSTFFDAETEISAKDGDDELDDDLSKMKEVLDEAELEAGTDGVSEGEWSLHVKRSVDKHSHLYLFARTGRDKHDWFRRLNSAIWSARAASADSSRADDKDDKDAAVYRVADKDTVTLHRPSKASESGTDLSSSAQPPEHADMESYEKAFWPYLNKVIQSRSSPSPCPCRSLPSEMSWMNTVLARVLYDVMRDPSLNARVQDKIQRKLHTMKLPSFMSPLVVTQLTLSGAVPLLRGLSGPRLDDRGVWLQADLSYDGGAAITILTQINLLKLKEKNITLEDQLLMTSDNLVEQEPRPSLQGAEISERTLRERKPAIYDSDLEDSAESSSDDESPPPAPDDCDDASVDNGTALLSTPETGSSKKKFLRMVDKIATNKYFQQVTDYKYVKRAMEGLSNTDIKLQLELVALDGQLAVNLPPPPHDRLWVGFRTNPTLVLKAKPAFGARALRFAHISNWIEQKLSKEFEKFLVLPNMEDFVIDVLTPTPVGTEE